MSKTGRPNPEVEALRERLSRLIDAGHRISESLDLPTVLREIVEAARTLTGARHAGITTVDGSGKLEHFVTSGLDAEERGWFLEQPLGETFCELMREELRKPFRLPDLSVHLTSRGYDRIDRLAVSYLGAPIRHRGKVVGSLFLASKEGRDEFGNEDEELLAMFTTQVAAANLQRA